MLKRSKRPHKQKKIINGCLQCSRCHSWKPTSEFNKGELVCGFTTKCKACNAIKAARWRQRYPAKYRRYHLRTKFGIDLATYDKLLRQQDGLCAICQSAPNGKPFHVDHDHSSHVIRGLLCDNCNMAIGLLQDDPEMIRRAARYINAPTTS